MNVIDRRDLLRILNHILHGANREDIDVNVFFVVEFSSTTNEDVVERAVIDPYQEFPRRIAHGIVKEAIERIDVKIANVSRLELLTVQRKLAEGEPSQGEPCDVRLPKTPVQLPEHATASSSDFKFGVDSEVPPF